jgi:drug/metabolite transporter (DMT)-like permease
VASILFALVAATSYGSADFLSGPATRRSSLMPVMMFSQLAGLVLGERLRWIQIAGLSCAGLGVVLIGAG